MSALLEQATRLPVYHMALLTRLVPLDCRDSQASHMSQQMAVSFQSLCESTTYVSSGSGQTVTKQLQGLSQLFLS